MTNRGIQTRSLAAVLGFWVLLVPALTPAAAPSCHCFRDRDYDPAHPGKSDDYLLATAANTLLSAVYGVPKRDIVEARMSGTSGEDLWISTYAANRLKSDPAVLQKARAAATSWREALRARGGNLEPLGPRFTVAIANGSNDEALSRIAAAETLAGRLGTPRTELDELDARGATLQETVLAALLGVWSSRAAPQIYADAKAGKSSWSRLLAAQNRVPKQMETEIPKLLQTRQVPHPRPE